MHNEMVILDTKLFFASLDDIMHKKEEFKFY